MKYLQIFSVLFCLTTVTKTHCADKSQTWLLEKSEIEYTVEFPLKTVKGNSKVAKGKGVCDEKTCHFLVATQVVSFKSGDRNRDMHMLEVTKATEYPLVTFEIDVGKTFNQKNIGFEIEFASVKKSFSNVPVTIKIVGNQLKVNLEFDLLLSKFNVTRPTLLGIPVNDKVKMKIRSVWSTNNVAENRPAKKKK